MQTKSQEHYKAFRAAVVGYMESVMAGAPTKYKPEYCEAIIELGVQGKSVTYMAGSLGVHKDTLYEWIKEHDQFSDAFTHAKALSQMWWEDRGQQGMEKGASEFQGSIWSRSMAARFPDDWREVKARDHTSSDGSMSPKEIIIKAG